MSAKTNRLELHIGGCMIIVDGFCNIANAIRALELAAAGLQLEVDVRKLDTPAEG